MPHKPYRPRQPRYDQRPLTEQERSDLLAAHERYQQTTAVWIKWLDGDLTGTPAEREAARQDASQASQTEIAILKRIKAARVRSRTPEQPEQPEQSEG